MPWFAFIWSLPRLDFFFKYILVVSTTSCKLFLTFQLLLRFFILICKNPLCIEQGKLFCVTCREFFLRFRLWLCSFPVLLSEGPGVLEPGPFNQCNPPHPCLWAHWGSSHCPPLTTPGPWLPSGSCFLL